MAILLFYKKGAIQVKQKHWQVSVFDKTSETIKNDTFYTTDTEAYLIFELIDEGFTPDSATVTVYNVYGKATINASVEVADGIARYEIPEEAIGHPGGWRTQVIYTKDNEDYTTGIINFDVGGHLLDNKKPAIVDIENWNSFIAHARDLIDDWEQLEEIRQANEQQRELAESARQNEFETNETERQTEFETNETSRQANELVRKSAEVIRLANEGDRVNAETIRAEFYEGFDGRLGDLESDKVVLKNLVKNGDFSDGFNGWTLFNNPQIVNGRVHLKRLKGEPLVAIGYQDRTIFDNRDDIYYFAAQGEVVTFDSGNGGIMVNDSQAIKAFWTFANQPKGIVSRGSSVGSLSSNANPYIYANTIGGVEYYIDYIMTINLTETFGAGNEPTKAELDELIKITGYFDEITLTQKQLLNWQLKLMRQNRNALIALGGTII